MFIFTSLVEKDLTTFWDAPVCEAREHSGADKREVTNTRERKKNIDKKV